ncbi:MAG: asparagine synthase-related protein [Acidobacteriota bacterium]
MQTAQDVRLSLRIEEASARTQARIDSGRQAIIGVNKYPLVAMFLSGGIDSTLMAAAARRAGISPRTFTVGFSEKEYDESAQAREVAAALGTDHTEVQLNAGDQLALIPQALRSMDHPTGDGVNTFVISSVVHDAGIKVAISGVGGDELFGGYPSFRRLRPSALGRLFARTPAGLRRAGAAVAGALTSSTRSEKMTGLLRSDLTVGGMFPILRQVFSPRAAAGLIAPALDTCFVDDPYEARLKSKLKDFEGRAMSAVSYAESVTYMSDVLLRDADQMGMAHSLELRVPFLDHPLAEFTMGLPDSVKYDPSLPKSLLLDLLRRWMPSYPAVRPKKGFALPFDPRLRGPLRDFSSSRLATDRIASRGILQPAVVRDLWTSFLDRRGRISWSRIWTLVVLEEWIERNGVIVN